MWGKSLFKWSRCHDQDGCHAHIWLKFSNIFYRTNIPMILKCGMEHYVLNLYNDYINNDPESTLVYFTTMSNLAKLVFALGPDIR